ncbi:MAG TPA: pyridoxamine 5'-phosphate oxidase family protein, partial [Burkholderiaceae bacterium]|nr:pyridoxamine 5'-phosphate oxidase family protein [Burkholderiaceae bacterium]
MSTALGDIRACLEGAIPAVMATCSADGTPNVAYISQVFYVDERHVALSFQFFNKTRENILANPHATVLVLHPVTVAFYRLHIRYLRTETEGPLFEGMKAQLAGIASHSGMAGVFRLLGSDVYEVREIESVEGEPLPAAPPRSGMLSAVRRCSERLARCTALDELLNAALATLADFLAIRHAMVLMLDASSQRLYTVASCGYATSGVGSEIAIGDGVIGVAARERTPVRITHMTSAYLYSRAMRSSLEANVPDLGLETDIPYPGLAEPHSQL